ncbi:hypothetical protein MN608_00345 [Microdochium nivale]|nr:hypothetical protein MN608_00345 [Microdochium nivale]
MTSSPGSTFVRSSLPGHNQDDTVPNGPSDSTLANSVSNLELGILSFLLAILSLVLARIVHMLAVDYSMTARREEQQRQPPSPGEVTPHPRVADIRQDDGNCHHDTTVQTFLPRESSETSSPNTDLMAAGASFAAMALDFAGETALRGVQMLQEIGRNTADLNKAWSGDLPNTQDEEAGGDSYEDSGSSTEVEEWCRRRDARPRRSSPSDPA